MTTPATPALPAPAVHVSLVHADLARAQHTLIVGHYVGDLIVSAEAYLDQQLGGALSRRFQLGSYPGPLRTSARFKHPGPVRSPPAALVVGLGQVGELSPSGLRASVRLALLEAAQAELDGLAAQGPPLSLRFSTLLVGTGGAGLSIRDSVDALLRAVLEANDRLQTVAGGRAARIESLEIIELYEDLAIAAAHALTSALQATELHGHVAWPDPVVISPAHSGGRRRRSFDTDRSWDKRIEILEHDGHLQFTVAGQRARAEMQLTTGQVVVADAFLRGAVGSMATDTEVSRTLFEMLLPLEFRESSPDERGLVLLLDRQSARFPWELLEDRWSLNGRPLAIEASMVRQFKTDTYRAAPQLATDPHVLVIGDPLLDGWAGLEPLDGARREAEAVVALFEQQWPGAHVAACVGARVGDIQRLLHERPWRVLHLAGHGLHQEALDAMTDARTGSPPTLPPTGSAAPGPLSGMVIGPEVLLGPGDVQQLRHVPELVFVNCCHLGRTDRLPGAYHRLAANLGEQFIAMGVRAVVAAGWAVDDAAAATFAQAFYAALLEGQAFRDAVRLAREQTHREHPGVNTWGAFQCYGEPGWRLQPNGQTPRTGSADHYHAPQELMVDLGNLLASQRAQAWRAPTAREPAADAAALGARLDKLLALVPPQHLQAWVQRADVAAALGPLRAAAGQWNSAAEHLRQAVTAPEGDGPMHRVEQWLEAALAMPNQGAERTDALRAALSCLATLDPGPPPAGRACTEAAAWAEVALGATSRAGSAAALTTLARRLEAAWAASGGALGARSVSWWLAATALLDRLGRMGRHRPRVRAAGGELSTPGTSHLNDHGPLPGSASPVARAAAQQLLSRVARGFREPDAEPPTEALDRALLRLLLAAGRNTVEAAEATSQVQSLARAAAVAEPPGPHEAREFLAHVTRLHALYAGLR